MIILKPKASYFCFYAFAEPWHILVRDVCQHENSLFPFYLLASVNWIAVGKIFVQRTPPWLKVGLVMACERLVEDITAPRPQLKQGAWGE